MFIGYTCAAFGAVQDDLGVDDRLISAGHLVPAHTVGAEVRSSQHGFTEPMAMGGYRIPEPDREISLDAAGKRCRNHVVSQSQFPSLHGVLDLVVAGVVGGELWLEMASGNLTHRSF